MQHEGNTRKTFTAKNISKNNQEFKVAWNDTEVIQGLFLDVQPQA